jgi:glycosyltransferase involved in cell wall biosynthesis
MAERVRVLLLIPHLGGGGAEQVTALLARGLSREKYELHLGLITQAGSGGATFPGITVHGLGASRVRAGAFGFLRLVWRLRPQVILSNMAHLNFLVLLLRPFFPRGTRVLVRQNGTVSADLASGRAPAYTGFLYRLLYRHADRVICPSQAMAEDLVGELGVDRELIAVLPNPVDGEGIHAAEDAPNGWTGSGPHLLAVGRLSPEKGFDLLLEAMEAIRTRFPHADLILAGEGPERKALEELRRQFGLEAAVRFAGLVQPPFPFYPGASLFVLPSRHEGLPNALLEALTAGLPLAALPASGGVVDLLRGCPGAWLAEEISAPALARTLTEALEDLRPGERFAREFGGNDELRAKGELPGNLAGQFDCARAIEAYEAQIDAFSIEGRMCAM